MRGLAFLPTFFLACALAGFASADPGGTLSGSVRTTDGTPLTQVVLTVAGPSGTRTVVTGPDGRYRVTGLTAGEYQLVLETAGFTLVPEPRTEVAEGENRLDLAVVPASIQEHVTVTAARSDAPSTTVGVSATVLEGKALAEREAPSVLLLLQDVPGVAAAQSGGLGLQASAFVRGGEARFARVLVDGVPVNQAGGAFDFGGVVPLELERIEVVRGAASSLYGSDALAGVIHFISRRAAPGEKPSLRAEAEAGSFDFRRWLGGTSGRAGLFDWSLGMQRLTTDNQQPNSAFEQNAGALSAGARFGQRTLLRFALRGSDGSVGTPGPTAFGRPDLDASYDRSEWTTSALIRHSTPRFVHELQAGFAASRQLSRNPLDSGSYLPRAGDRVGAFPVSDFPDPEGYRNDSDRLFVSLKSEAQASASHLLSLGADLERETGIVGSGQSDRITPERTNLGLYAQDRALIGDRIHVTLGARVESNESYGTKTVPRLAVAWQARRGEDSTLLRASAGAGVKEPSFLQSFGVSIYARGNPDLRPETSRTFDLGIEQRLFRGRVRAEATVFHHDYRDQIAYTVVDYTTFEGTYVNLGRTRARGLELSLDTVPIPELRFSADYTFLDGSIRESASNVESLYAVGQPLLRRPKHQLSVSARGEVGRVSAGATLAWVGKRADSDFLGLGLTSNSAYARLDARVHVILVRSLEAFVVAENLLDHDYQAVLGYPALGRSLRVGLRFGSQGLRGRS